MCQSDHSVDEAPAFALVLLNGDGIIFANSFAEEILRSRDGMASQHGRLCISGNLASHALRDAVRLGGGGAGGAMLSGLTLTIPRGPGKTPFTAHVTHLRPHDTADEGEVGATAVFIVDPDRDLSARLRSIASLYGLTPAEERLLTQIAEGAGLVAAAAALGITESTARTHLKRVLAKTGTVRQTELIRLLFTASLPDSRDGAR